MDYIFFFINIFKKKNLFVLYKYKFKIILLIFFLHICVLLSISFKSNNLKIALCTMGKKENLYVKEFIDYYIKLGINHIFI